MSEEKALAERAPTSIGRTGVEIQNMDQLARFASMVHKSGLAPKGLDSPESIAVAIQLGFEVGFGPMTSVQNIAPINGRPSIWGDAQLGLVRGSGKLELFSEWFEIDGKKLPRNPTEYPDALVAVCRVKRVGQDPGEVGFSVADAKRAGLWGKPGPWSQYPFRMLKSRARSFALRDSFGDVLKGIASAEEVSDITIDVPSNVSIVPAVDRALAPKPEATPEPTPPPAADPQPSARERLAQLITDIGAEWGDFQRAIESNLAQLRFTALPASIHDVSEEQAEACLARQRVIASRTRAAASERLAKAGGAA